MSVHMDMELQQTVYQTIQNLISECPEWYANFKKNGNFNHTIILGEKASFKHIWTSLQIRYKYVMIVLHNMPF